MQILVVDDHALFREGLVVVLRGLGGDIRVLEAGTCDEALQVAKDHRGLSLAILDLALPEVDGLTTLEVLREREPTLPAMILSASTHPANVRRALRLGAAGYMSKADSGSVVLEAVRVVLAGGTYIPPNLAEPKKTGRPFHGETLCADLTPRQREVLRHVAAGQPNKVIARELGLSEPTVKAHLAAIYRALNVKNRTEAASLAGMPGLPVSGTQTQSYSSDRYGRSGLYVG